MRRAFAFFVHEWRQMVLSPAFLLLGTLFLLLESLIFLFVLQAFVRGPHFLRPTAIWLQSFWTGTLLLIPPLTMRCVAEERHRGILDGLLSTSMGHFPIVLCKFLALWLNYLALWAIAVALQWFIFTFTPLTLPFPPFIAAEWRGIFVFLALTGALHISVGVFFSTVTRTPMVAAALTFAALLLLLFGPGAVVGLPIAARIPAPLLARLEIIPFLGECVSGIFDSRTVVLYGTGSITVLILSSLFLRRL